MVTGGGTGGHIYPAIAVAEALRKSDPSIQLHYVGGLTGPETEIVPNAGIPFLAVKSKKLRKLASLSTLGVLWALWQGYREAAAFLKDFNPDVVVSTGGYVAAATGIAAARQGRPLVIQACDAVPGRTNLWLAKHARRICIWFEGTREHFDAEKAVATCVPLREGIVSQRNRAEARSALGLREDLFTVLVIGGSQGARRLNQLVVGMLPHVNSELQILHQTGPRNIDEVRSALSEYNSGGIPYDARPYLNGEEVPLAYRSADLVICRCGISTLAEVTANALPALMVPLPTAYADHQTANAREVQKAGGGRLLPEPNLTSEELARHVAELQQDPAERQRMSDASKSLGRPDAADQIARIVIALGTGQRA